MYFEVAILEVVFYELHINTIRWKANNFGQLTSAIIFTVKLIQLLTEPGTNIYPVALLISNTVWARENDVLSIPLYQELSENEIGFP